MAVNLLEEDRLVYHDEDGDTLEINVYGETLRVSNEVFVICDKDSVETLRDALTCWLETGKLKRPTELELEELSDAQLAFERGYDGDI